MQMPENLRTNYATEGADAARSALIKLKRCTTTITPPTQETHQRQHSDGARAQWANSVYAV